MLNILGFSQWSLRSKLVAIIMLCSAVTLMAGLSLLLTSFANDRYENSLHELTSLANVLSENGQAALAFGDSAEAERLLSSLKGHREIGAAWLVTGENKVLAGWHRSQETAQIPVDYQVGAPLLKSSFWSQTASLSTPVMRGELHIGYVVLLADFSDQWRQQLLGLARGASAAFAALVVMFFWVNRLQRVVSEPIIELAQTARVIAQQKQYELRVNQTTNDEVGELVSAFNLMISEIMRRDSDLTQQRDQLEYQVRLRTQELRSILENSPDTITRYDTNCRRIYLNPAFAEVSGINARSPTPSEHSVGGLSELYASKLKDVIASAEEAQFDVTWTTERGAQMCIHLRLTPELGSDGTVHSVLVVGRDITGHKQVERQLQLANSRSVALNEQLSEQNVLLEKMLLEQKERERELEASRRLLRDIEQRELLNAERQRLMQDMHDGLGSSLISALQVVEHGGLKEADIADVLKSCIDDLKLTIDSLETAETDLLLLLATLRFRLGPRLNASGIRLIWSVQPVPALVWLDSANALHILRILQECITNVIKHAYANQIELSTLVDGNWVQVCVEDNGRGFSVKDAYQRSNIVGGRGLNNQLRRASSIGAKLDITSRPVGSKLVLSLPVVRSALIEQSKSEL